MIVRLLAPVTAAVLLVSTVALAQDASRPANTEEGPAAVTAPVAAPAPAAAAAAAPAAAAVAVDAGDFRIGPEDVLDVQVWKNADLSRVVPVRPDGRISLPLVNDIVAAGLTPMELRAQITQRLTPFIPAAEVSVIVREVHSFKVSIVGRVRMPGTYEVKSSATVLDIIARAQGFADFADSKGIIVHRKGSTATTQMPFNYERVSQGKEQDFVVKPGDIVVVP